MRISLPDRPCLSTGTSNLKLNVSETACITDLTCEKLHPRSRSRIGLRSCYDDEQATAVSARRPGKLTSRDIRAEHVALLLARDGLELAAAKRQARRYAKELTAAQSGSAVF